MTRPGGPHDFVYVHTDIPEGMTIREWRAQRAADRHEMRATARRRRRARAVRGWLAAVPVAFRRHRLSGRKAHG